MSDTYKEYLESFKANFGDEEDIQPLSYAHWLQAKESSEASGALHHAAGDHGYAQPRVETYSLKAQNGRHIRQATKVVFPDGREIEFLEKLSKREALTQIN